MKPVSLTRAALMALALGTFGLAPGADAQANPCNPCAANPCNPCAANPCNPCAANPCNPCGAKNPCNPCGANPCNPCGGARIDPAKIRQPSGLSLVSGAHAEQLALGEELWNDASLGNSGVACASCHVRAAGSISQMNASFAQPYPHRVAMPAQQAGLASVNAAEMVQFCMVAPMASQPLDWQSKELAALSAYVLDLQEDFTRTAGNPCGAANPCNPCAAKANPCGANPGNPCAGKNPCNPCAGRNPCNPCGAGNPCNPCGGGR